MGVHPTQRDLNPEKRKNPIKTHILVSSLSENLRLCTTNKVSYESSRSLTPLRRRRPPVPRQPPRKQKNPISKQHQNQKKQYIHHLPSHRTVIAPLVYTPTPSTLVATPVVRLQ